MSSMTEVSANEKDNIREREQEGTTNADTELRHKMQTATELRPE